MNAAETGTLWGLIVALIPGYRIKLGKPTLNKRQKRPIAAFIFFWLVTILGYSENEPAPSASLPEGRRSPIKQKG